MSRPTLFALTLIVTIVSSMLGDTRAQQQGPVTLPPPMSRQLHLYYEQHPDEFQALLQRLPPVSREIVPGTQLPAGQAPPVGGTWSSLAHPAPGEYPEQSDPAHRRQRHRACDLHAELVPVHARQYRELYQRHLDPDRVAAGGYNPLYFASRVLPDGRVMMAGGEYNNSGSGCATVWTTLEAIYDPLADAWSPVTAPAGWTSTGDAQASCSPTARTC